MVQYKETIRMRVDVAFPLMMVLLTGCLSGIFAKDCFQGLQGEKSNGGAKFDWSIMLLCSILIIGTA